MDWVRWLEPIKKAGDKICFRILCFTNKYLGQENTEQIQFVMTCYSIKAEHIY